MNEKIAFIGAGNMAGSLIGGLLSHGFDPALIRAADPSENQLKLLDRFGIDYSTDNSEVARWSDVLVLAVKPQHMQSVLSGIRNDLLTHQPLVISIAAGITIESIHRGLHQDLAIIRCMPNTPALIGEGAVAMVANTTCTDVQKQLAENIMSTAGSVNWLDSEKMMNAVTALSGSGPAYFFLVIEAMMEAGTALGLPEDVVHDLTLQTAYGACRMARESTDEPGELRRKVTSPGGTTEAALRSLDIDHIKERFKTALQAATKRGEELSRES